ncbi:hypothetical protein GGI19_000210 [Coemansia pectinata]|uniref:Uncharacterized protein n=1 Tax=Coemansia pectinata TaxID=1052879 RepID=A0A9W8H6T1_9FUNG|nr:hypothetical protein GGI19_000210 [Coemansia pectinata]
MQATLLGRLVGIVFLAITFQFFIAIPNSSTAVEAVLYTPAAGPALIDIAIDAPDFLIQVPFTVASGPSIVSGWVSIYFKATRSVKYITDGVGQFYLAKISTTTFLFIFQYQSSLWGGAQQQFVRDILYLDRVSAEIISLQVSSRLTIGAA